MVGVLEVLRVQEQQRLDRGMVHWVPVLVDLEDYMVVVVVELMTLLVDWKVRWVHREQFD
jgi:hypothetical protein